VNPLTQCFHTHLLNRQCYWTIFLLKWPNLEHLEILNPLVSIILSLLSPITYISHHERDITLTLYFCVVLIPFLTTNHYHEVNALALSKFGVYWPLSPTHRPHDNVPYIYLRENMYSSSSKQRPLISLIKRNLLHLSKPTRPNLSLAHDPSW